MARNGAGVEARDKSIRVGFTYKGEFVRETLLIEPTPANMTYAKKMVADVKRKIKDGTLVYADYFPDSVRVPKAPDSKSFGEMCDLWFEGKGRLAKKTRDQYRNSLEFWKRMFGANTTFDKLPHSLVSAKIGSEPWASAKLLNNYMITLRGVFKLAKRDMKIDDPTDGIENSKHQVQTPDPLSAEEMNQVLKWMEDNVDVSIWAYFEFAFMTGMRPEELIALKWTDVDSKHGTIKVERARTAGELKPLKTYNSREVEMVSRAVAALGYMKPITGNSKDGFIFRNPVTKRQWHDERSQRDHYWKPALKACLIRTRRAYQTRHTYATVALMAGANPTWVARQMGHKNARMLFQIYAKWIDGQDRGRERAKLEATTKQGA